MTSSYTLCRDYKMHYSNIKDKAYRVHLKSLLTSSWAQTVGKRGQGLCVQQTIGPLHIWGSLEKVPREGVDSSVIMPFSWCVVAVTLLYSVGPHPVSRLYIYTFVVSRAFMAGAASQAGDTDSSWAPGLISGLQGSVNVHRGALLLVP